MRQIINAMILPSEVKSRRILFGPAAGNVMELNLRAEFRIWLGLYEAELSPHFRRLVYPGARCFDIGGAEGYHSVMLASLSDQPVVVFEPGEIWYDKITSQLRRNSLRGEVVKKLIGNSCEEGITTIDVAAEEFFVPDFIKMDIEGAESDALLGAQLVLSHRRPHLIIEVHGQQIEKKCLNILNGYGYKPVFVEPRKWLKEYRPIEHNRWLVCEGRWPD